MNDLLQASQLAWQIGLPLIALSTIAREAGLPLARSGQLFGLVFLGWAAVFWLSRFLPWTYLGL